MTSSNDDPESLRAEIARLREAAEALEARAERAEEAVRASKAIHEALIESLPFDFWARDQDGRCFSQNATTRQHWGDLIGRRPEDMPFDPEVIAAWTANNRRALAGETVISEHDYPIGGQIAHVQSVLAPIRRGDAIIGTLGVNIDFTERKRALEALRESELKLRLAADAAGVGLWSWDHGVDRVEWSDVLCRIWGIDPDHVPRDRESYLAQVHPEDRDRARARIARGVEERWWSDEFRIVRGDGATRWVSSHARVLHVHDRDVAFGAVLDVTERRQRDERLRQAQKLEAVGQLTAGISHNFNNMLMGILPNLELAERRATPEIAPLLQAATQSAQRAAELVRQLMTFAGRNRHHAQAIEEVGPIVERSVTLCRTTFDQRIALVTNIDAAARARLDAAQIQQGILNVLINARDAVAAQDVGSPCVSIDVAVVWPGAAELEGRVGEFVRVRVRDNGVGMDAATMAHLYEPFFTTKDLGKGTGLGLATTHAIVREHGGFIACTSTPGRGTTVSLYFPSEAAPAETPAPPPLAPSARGTETVLLVDDEPAIRRAVAAILVDAGFDPRQAGSGEEALALLGDASFLAKVRLVLLDVSMPGMPSSVLRARLGQLAPEARVVYFTGYAYDAADTADAVLQKPVTRDELLTTVREVLDRPRTASLRP